MAITLVSSIEKTILDRIARQYDIEMEQRPLPTDEDVAALVGERLIALLEARLRQRDKLQTERSRRLAPLAHSLAEHENETAIITMLLDDYYQQMLHTPAAQPEVVLPEEHDKTGGKKSGLKKLGWRRRNRN